MDAKIFYLFSIYSSNEVSKEKVSLTFKLAETETELFKVNSGHLWEQREQQGVLKGVRIAIKSHPICQPSLGKKEESKMCLFNIIKYSNIRKVVFQPFLRVAINQSL